MHQLSTLGDEIAKLVRPHLSVNQRWVYSESTLLRPRHEKQYRVWQEGELTITITASNVEFTVRRKQHQTLEPLSVSPLPTTKWESLAWDEYVFTVVWRLQRKKWTDALIRKYIRG